MHGLLPPAPIPLSPGRLWALPQIYELDGRVTSHAPDIKGYAPNNCYLLRENQHALLLDTGLPVHRESILRQLDAVLDDEVELSILPSRINEFSSLSNVRAIAENFRLRRIYGLGQDPWTWFDFDPDEIPYGTTPRQGVVGALQTVQLMPGAAVEIDPAGGRALQVLPAPLQLLPTKWLYDAATRTLFTVDSFTHVWRPDETGPWTAGGDEELPGVDETYDHLTRTRFWWLPGTDTTAIRGALDRIFDEHEIDVIAPAFGCPLVGAGIVGRHRERLREVLARAATARSIGIEAGRWNR